MTHDFNSESWTWILQTCIPNLRFQNMRGLLAICVLVVCLCAATARPKGGRGGGGRRVGNGTATVDRGNGTRGTNITDNKKRPATVGKGNGTRGNNITDNKEPPVTGGGEMVRIHIDYPLLSINWIWKELESTILFPGFFIYSFLKSGIIFGYTQFKPFRNPFYKSPTFIRIWNIQRCSKDELWFLLRIALWLSREVPHFNPSHIIPSTWKWPVKTKISMQLVSVRPNWTTMRHDRSLTHSFQPSLKVMMKHYVISQSKFIVL